MKFVLGLLTLILVAAFALKPDAQSLEDEIMGQLRNEASNASVGSGDDLITGIAKLGCSVSPEDCARLIRATMTVELTDRVIAQTAVISVGDDNALDCIGVFNQWYCRAAE